MQIRFCHRPCPAAKGSGKQLKGKNGKCSRLCSAESTKMIDMSYTWFDQHSLEMEELLNARAVGGAEG